MKKKQTRRSIEELGESESEQEQGIDRLRIVLVIIIIILIAFFVAIIVLPPRVELSELQDELKVAEQQLKQAKEEEQQARNHLEWIEDPEYAEQIARDRADQGMEGEVILREAEAEEIEGTRGKER